MNIHHKIQKLQKSTVHSVAVNGWVTGIGTSDVGGSGGGRHKVLIC